MINLLPFGDDDREIVESELKALDLNIDDLTFKKVKSLTAVSGLIGIVTLSDKIWDNKEREEAVDILSTIFELNKATSQKVVKVAQVFSHFFDSNSEGFYCKLLKESCNKPQQEAVLNFLSRIAQSDDEISKVEKGNIENIAKLLDLKL